MVNRVNMLQYAELPLYIDFRFQQFQFERRLLGSLLSPLRIPLLSRATDPIRLLQFFPITFFCTLFFPFHSISLSFTHYPLSQYSFFFLAYYRLKPKPLELHATQRQEELAGFLTQQLPTVINSVGKCCQISLLSIDLSFNKV